MQKIGVEVPWLNRRNIAI